MTDLQDLDEKSKKLDEMANKLKDAALAIPFNTLARLVADVQSSKVLNEIFQTPVIDNLGLAIVDSEIKIVNMNIQQLSDDQQHMFFDELHRIIESYIN